MPRAVDLTDETFGMLRAIEVVGSHPKAGRLWRCECECGSEHVVSVRDLRSGNTTSCGCQRKAMLEGRNASMSKHGQAGKTSEYNTWASMKSRCNNPNHRAYSNYGGRGITVCPEWNESFEAFFRDMGEKPFEGATLDRKDSNGPYEKSNCRWATDQQQADNRRSTRLITRSGKTLSVAGWERELGIARGRLQARLRAGWTFEEAISLPFKRGVTRRAWKKAQE